MESLAVPECVSRASRRVSGIDWIVLCHVILLLCVGSWDRSDVVLRPPSLAFIDHDIDLDHWISREEWESRYGTSASERFVLDFDRGDCDRDGRLDWQEYYLVDSGRARCQASTVGASASQSTPTAVGVGSDALLISDRDLELAYVSLARSRQRLVAAKYHERYGEQDWPSGMLYQYSLSCGESEPFVIPELSQDFRRLSRLATLSQGPHAAVRCSVVNRSRHTVTYLRLQVSVATAQGSADTLHGKTLWVPGGESRDFWVLTDPSRTVARVSVLGVRVARD